MALQSQFRTFVLQRWFIAGLLFFFLAVISYHFVPAENNPISSGATKPLFLSVLIPSHRQVDTGLCKTVLTAQVLNYPVPVVVPPSNGTAYDVLPSKETYNGLTRHHLNGVLHYLNDLVPEAEDGIAIVLDGPNTLFQLRPEVLLHRYFRLLQQADLRRKKGDALRHSVVIPAHSGCNQDSRSPACENVVEPGAGSQTFGMIVGPARDVRAILSRTLADPGFMPQPFLADVFQEQELHRENTKSSWWALTSWNSYGPRHEFGIVLDRAGELSAPVTFQDENWRALSPAPEEVQRSAPPFWTVSGGEAYLPHASGWTDLKLFNSKSAAPALFYHSESEDASTREELWSRHWMQPHARSLYTASQLVPATAVASVVNSDGLEQIFWNRATKSDKAGAYTVAKDTWMSWPSMCEAEEQWKEVFRDGLGPWKGTVPFVW